MNEILELRGAKLLLVDDTPANLKVLGDLLESEGYDLALAADGAMALKIAQRLRPELILLDVMMPGMDGFVGQSATMRKIFADIQLIQGSANTSVLITGESGTGKELIARAVHFGSARRAAPFIPVNCASMPRELAESLLFGHVQGAFTGADSDKVGFFEMAHEGTLFLDELGEMPLEL